MEKLAPDDYIFEKNIIYGSENINNFYSAIKDPKTKYFWDLDQILVNSAKYIFDKFNRENSYKLTANVWQLDQHDYLTAVVEAAGFTDHTDLETDWYKNWPLYKSESFKYSKEALKIAIDMAGAQNNYFLTSRSPKLRRATCLWIKQEIPEFGMENLLIRKKGDARDSLAFKIDTLEQNSGDDYKTIFVEDQERFIKGALEAEVKNLLVIGSPNGKVTYTIQDPRLLVLARYPFKQQELLPLYSLFEIAQNIE
jgi:hypothetical protein